MPTEDPHVEDIVRPHEGFAVGATDKGHSTRHRPNGGSTRRCDIVDTVGVTPWIQKDVLGARSTSLVADIVPGRSAISPRFRVDVDPQLKLF